MINKLSTFYVEEGKKGKAVIGLDTKRDMFVVDYYDDHGKHFFMEEYPGKTLSQVESIVEDWTMGYKQLA